MDHGPAERIADRLTMPTGPKSKSKPKATSRRMRPAPADGAAAAFFETLHAQGDEPILKGESGVLRFDLSRGTDVERWYVTIADGNITVGHRGGSADIVVKVDRALFDRIAEGTENAMAAQLRGALVADGDLHLLMTFQRLFPGPPRQSTPRPIPAAEMNKEHR